jgi:hypothetical protein
VFDRYNVTWEADLAEAAAKVSQYVAERAARAMPLPIAFDENQKHGQSTLGAFRASR